MVKTFQGLDNEFAVSTGSNVNSGPGTSTFDYPPNSSFDLTVTSNAGDPDPNFFGLGETYDITYSGPGGAHTLEDAEVVRSDAAPDGGGIIVFEGLDEDGQLTQVIWTPDFDLENWYWTNYGPSAEPGFYTTDQNATYTHQYVCFAADTVIATPHGPLRAGDLHPGDRVFTLDAGHREILWIGRKTVGGHDRNCPVLFAPGAIGNARPLRLSQQHRVMFRSPEAELMFGSNEVLVPAKAMVNGRDIRFAPCPSVDYVHLLLDSHQVLLAGDGAPCESLLPGDMVEDILADDMPEIRRKAAGRFPYLAARPILTFREALCLLGASLPDPAPVLAML